VTPDHVGLPARHPGSPPPAASGGAAARGSTAPLPSGASRRTLSLAELFHPYRRVEGRFALIVVGVLFLSAFDAGSTIYLMGEGLVEEANPFMRHLIEQDVGLFALWKQWLTGGCLLIAATMARVPAFGVLEGRVILRLALTGYLILTGWHLTLIALVRMG
jgi:hypothetical protein